MFYPKCPRCGGKTTSHVSDPYTERQWQMAPHALKSVHPVLGIGASAANAGRSIAKRTSLMKKECLECGHIFN